MRRMLLLAAVACFALPAANARAADPAPLSYTGDVGGCKYTLTLNTSGKTGSAATKNCVDGALSATLTVKYAQDQVTLSDVHATATIDGHSVSIDESPDWSFSAGVNVEAIVEAAVLAGDPASAQRAADAMMHAAETQLEELALEEIVGGALGSDGIAKKVEDAEKSFCQSVPVASSECAGSAPKAASVNPDDAANLDSSPYVAMCPANLAQSQVVFVCLPSFVAGDLDTGGKPIVLLPGGILIALPIGGPDLLNLNTTPTISSSKAIVSMGGIVVGVNAKLKAPDLALAAGLVDVSGNLALQGDNVNVGHVDLGTVTGALPSFDGDLKNWMTAAKTVNDLHVVDIPPTTGAFDTPLSLGASSITVTPAKSFTLGASSTLSSHGRGGAGGTAADGAGGLPGGEAPGGAKDDYGGSHGGYGGYEETPADWQAWGIWQDRQGRGPVYDDPFAPTQPGNGGSGNPDDSVGRGANGGGVVRIDAGKAAVKIDGSVDVEGNGLNDDFSDADTGGAGAGAGGSAYVTAKTLTGTGDISADGGGYCADCDNGFGGMGGGGRIALIYGDASGWHGAAHAHGGIDDHFHGLDDPDGWPWYFRGTGGAGTLFTRQVTFDDGGAVKEGKGDFADGTLTVDGGQSPGFYPPPDGTPIDDAWGTDKRKLVLTGEARAYGVHPDFGEIDVLDGSRLTTEFTTQTLDVHAGTLKVDADSRIDMSGRGYAGGPAGFDADDPNGGAAATAPDATPSVIQAGGSHGGGGGLAWAANYVLAQSRAGSTYGDPQNPSLPGGGGAGSYDTGAGNPGGGVLDVTADTLQLDGELSANGQDTNGPTTLDPTPHDNTGGAGAGGSVLVHATRLSGDGTIRADGGWSCLSADDHGLLPHASECLSSYSGGGGGGRVAVYATACDWHGALSAAGGANPQITDAQPVTTGDPGSTYFSDQHGSCTAPEPTPTPTPSPTPTATPQPTATPTPQPIPAPTPVPPAHTDSTPPRLAHFRFAGRTLRVRVSERGTVKAMLARCRTKRVHGHRKTVCRTAKTLTAHRKKAGTVKLTIPRKLKAGRYRVTLRATDGAGNRSRKLVRTIRLR